MHIVISLKTMARSFLYTAAVCFSFFQVSVFARLERDLKILGGVVVDIKQFPYQVSLLTSNGFICGGSLIARELVLTAAHCCERRPTSVRVGSSFTKRGGRVYGIKDIKIHPKYDNIVKFGEPFPIFDVCGLKLEQKVSLGRNVQLIPLLSENKKIPPRAVGTVSGWGTIDHIETYPDQLRALDVRTFSKYECTKMYGSELTESAFCAGRSQPDKDACSGDSGGPLVVKGELVGIVSSGKECGYPKFPTLYASVSELRSFIDSLFL